MIVKIAFYQTNILEDGGTYMKDVDALEITWIFTLILSKYKKH